MRLEALRPTIPALAWLIAGVLAPGGPRAARAQEPAARVVRVRLADGVSGLPVSGAEVSVVRGLRRVVAQALTDDGGQRVLTVPGDTGEYQVVVRKIGYRRADRFFPATGREPLILLFSMTRIAQPLAAVAVNAKADAARKSYYIDNEEIANSDRPLFTSVDIIEKLRPDMIWGRGGPGGPCGKISSVFVNGRRILQAPFGGIVAASARALPAPRMRTSAGRTVQVDKYRVTGMPAEILSVIKPEHIAEMTYNDCFEKSAQVNRGGNAVFIILKPGVGYSYEDGSYVVDPENPRQRSARTSRAGDSASTGVEPWRFRILGVFDNDTGESIEGAEIVDVLTGTTATTTKTGTVSLTFLPEGGSELLVKKAGYKPITIEVLISPRDTVPITLRLAKNR